MEASFGGIEFLDFAFDEGRRLPNLLDCLLSRRFPVHASES